MLLKRVPGIFFEVVVIFDFFSVEIFPLICILKMLGISLFNLSCMLSTPIFHVSCSSMFFLEFVALTTERAYN